MNDYQPLHGWRLLLTWIGLVAGTWLIVLGLGIGMRYVITAWIVNP